MGLSEEIGDIAGGMSAVLLLLVKIGPMIGREQLSKLSLLFMACAVVVAETMEAEQREADEKQRRLVVATRVVCEESYDNANRKRSKLSWTEYELSKQNKKMRECTHNHTRAHQCVTEDWLGTSSTFSDRNFEQTFRLSRGIVERLIQACGNHAPAFFTTKPNCAGKAAISIEVKVLGIIKCVAYGCSGRAFQDYHQMAPNTFTEGLKAFFRALKADKALHEQYMRAPTKSDIKRITDLHEKVHNVPGMLGCLDCLHVSRTSKRGSC
jgi:hypothetical protein